MSNSVRPWKRTAHSSTESRSDSAEELVEMDLFDHIRELRKRLLYAVVAVAITSIGCFSFSKEAFEFFNHPFREAFPEAALIGTGPAEAFILRLKISVFCGILVALPILFYQVWAFVAPGLYERERRLVLPFLFSSTFLFLLGVLFCYEVVMPFAYDFFRTQFEEISIEPTIRISENLSLLIKALLGFGLVFQMPVLAFFFARLGVLTTGLLRATFRYTVIVIFVIAAILTPPDILTQMLMAGPMLLLYALSYGIVSLVEGRRSEVNKSTEEL